MGFYLLPFAVLLFFLGVYSAESARTQNALPTTQEMMADVNGQMFLSYRNAVAVYQQNNPTFTGNVTNAVLASQGSQFSASFLASAGNAITSIGGGAGRIITCYAALPAGSITSAITAAQNDASLGIASGTTWTSYSTDSVSTPTALATSVPNGDIVSVVQIGG